MNPKVSIVMPAFNASAFILESINSVVAQTYTDWELIIVDDGSTDSTENIIKSRSMSDSRIKLISQQNKKQAAARNTGLKAALGEYISFIDADDLWDQKFLQTQISNFCVVPADVIYTAGKIFYEETATVQSYPSVFGIFSSKEMYLNLYQNNPVPNLGVMFKREWIPKVGYQNEEPEIVGCEDWDYWIRFARVGARFCGIDQSLFTYRYHSEGMSRNTVQMKIAEIHVLYKNLDANMTRLEVLIERVTQLIVGFLPRLIQINRNKEASIEAGVLYQLKGKINYRILSGYLKWSSHPSSKVISFLLSPKLVFKRNKLVKAQL